MGIFSRVIIPSVMIITVSAAHSDPIPVMFRTERDFLGDATEHLYQTPPDIGSRKQFIERLAYRRNTLPKYPAMMRPVQESLLQSREDILIFALENQTLLLATDTLAIAQTQQYAWLVAEYASNAMATMETGQALDTPYESALEALAFLSEFINTLELMDQYLTSIDWSSLRGHIDKALGHMLHIANDLKENAYRNSMSPSALSELISTVSSTIKSQRPYNQSHRNFATIGIKIDQVLNTYNIAAPFGGEQPIDLGVYIQNKKPVIKHQMNCWPIKTVRETPFFICTELKKMKKPKSG